MQYLINEGLKAVKRGSSVAANLDKGEFVFDTKAPDDSAHSKAVMFGIADANNIIIPDSLNDRVKIAGKLSDELSKLNFRINKMSEELEKAKEIIVAGIEADKTDDEIMVDMVTGGISFKSAGRLFKRITEEEGLRLSNKSRQEQVFKILKKARFNPKEYAEVQSAIEQITSEVADTDETKAMRLIRRYAKEAEIVLPKAPKRTSRGRSAIQSWMIANPSATKDEFVEYMEGIGKKEAIINRTWEWFEVAKGMVKTLQA